MLGAGAPAEHRVQTRKTGKRKRWIPAFAGMTGGLQGARVVGCATSAMRG
jgi:hypothetical protein